jgi:hypothetical protein
VADDRLHNLLFLLTCSSLALGCAAEDDPGGDAGSDGTSTTAGTGTSSGPMSTSPSGTGVSGSDASATSTSTTTDPGTTTDVGTNGTTGSGGEPTSSTTMVLDLCEEFAMLGETCGIGTAEDLEMYCDFTLNDAMVQGQDCYDASLEVFVCAVAVDCKTLMMGPAGSCPEEYEAAQQACQQ